MQALLSLPFADLLAVCLEKPDLLDKEFWQEKFALESMPIVNEQSSALAWAAEYKRVRVALLYTLRLLDKAPLYLALCKIKDVGYLPDSLHTPKIKEIFSLTNLSLLISTPARAAMKIKKKENNYQVTIYYRQDEFSREERQLLCPKQVKIMVFILCYYNIEFLTGKNKKPFHIARRYLENIA
ncbi:hypothetical protein BQ9231_00198 [Cedratvirus lausannensis]|uniref:Uncharacterized protein n=1 Tax=Cedratvirus lausannensis TaxID=2023205 RepID=A0A285PWS9_9VIRU|nr:hypothetical protein BQ9231_00198 [Cedratvirus lausannensis]